MKPTMAIRHDSDTHKAKYRDHLEAFELAVDSIITDPAIGEYYDHDQLLSEDELDVCLGARFAILSLSLRDHMIMCAKDYYEQMVRIVYHFAYDTYLIPVEGF